MSRYDGLIIPRSYSEYLNKTDSATLSQMLQHLTGLWSHAVSAGDNKPVTSNSVYEALTSYINKTDAATLQQALQLPGVLSGAVAAGDNKAVTSNAVNNALTYLIKTTIITINASEFRTNTSWITKTIKLPNANNKIITAQIIGYSESPTIITYWGFELRVVSTDGSYGLIAIRKTSSDDWNENINILIIYY